MDDVTNPTPDDATAEADIDAGATEVAETNDADDLGDLDGLLDTDTLDTGEPDDDSEEIDWDDGKKYRIPKAIKPALLMHADYTRKTQEIAETRRTLETERERFTQQAQAREANFKEVVQLANIDQQLEQFGKLNWDAVQADDPLKAQELFRRYQLLNNARAEIGGRLQEAERKRALETQQATAKRLEEGNAVLAREIPNWSPESARKLNDFAVSKLGFTAQEVSGVTDPRHVKTLYLATLGQQWLDKQRATAQAKKPEAKPVTQVGTGKASAGKNPDTMPMSEWVEYERKRLLKQER